ncbi:hypothetical protein [Mitsuaria sp. 7]|uniref:hypothetical protein n=1 Tax=Mitsuaria sp. 7 TaxID=1658665 RepID=UPI0007DD65EA|nr:hypothetical protein [Mitsuaria sp. 7]ANH70977.1 hypothetical protein ABE85_25975 [Mitsuaria sp. 7]
MTSPLQGGRIVDAVSLPSRSSAGTRFEQAVAQVARINRPLSPALDQARDAHLALRLTASMDEAQAKLGRLQDRMQRTNDARLAPLVALQMQELDYRSTVAAKALGKVGATIKEVATSA